MVEIQLCLGSRAEGRGYPSLASDEGTEVNTFCLLKFRYDLYGTASEPDDTDSLVRIVESGTISERFR